jgi:hypothetical protein
VDGHPEFLASVAKDRKQALAADGGETVPA